MGEEAVDKPNLANKLLMEDLQSASRGKAMFNSNGGLKLKNGALFWCLLILVCVYTTVATSISEVSSEQGIMYLGSPVQSPLASPSSLVPSTAPDSLVPLLPSSPMYPFVPTGPAAQTTLGLCGINPSSMDEVIKKTAIDCMGPLAKFVGNVICCPQFGSMVKIIQGQLSSSNGNLALNKTASKTCFSEAVSFLVDLGANDTLPQLCSISSENMTTGLCPVSTVKDFQKIVNKSDLLAACTSINPIKECCKPLCSQAIRSASTQLATRVLSSLEQNGDSAPNKQRVVDDCQGVVHSWLASQLGPETANAAFRNLYSCKVNKACPLVFKDPSSVVDMCSGTSPSNITCCMSLYSYISDLQKQMLITNVQALECVTIFASMLMKRGVKTDLFQLCQVNLKDFSLQVHGNQGCLLRAIPSDVVEDKSSGISFTCDLNDNIAAPWPSSSQSSFSLCSSSNNLPALPGASPTSGADKDSGLIFWMRILFTIPLILASI